MPAEIERFRTELADLIENRVPASLRQRLEGKGAKELGLDLQSMPCKLVLSLREDFLADLETWRASIPSLRRNRMRLLPMRAGNALRAIHNEHTAHLVDEASAREIVSFLAARSASEGEAGSTAGGETTSVGASDDSEIDPALLSLFCAGVNARRQRAGASRIDASLIDAAKQTVVADFYRECVADQPPNTRAFIEDELVTENGFRNSYSVDEAIARDYLSEPQLDTLVNRRLLRRTHLLGTDRIELTHDLLTKAVVQERGTRLKLERKRRDGKTAGACRSGLPEPSRPCFWRSGSPCGASDCASRPRSNDNRRCHVSSRPWRPRKSGVTTNSRPGSPCSPFPLARRRNRARPWSIPRFTRGRTQRSLAQSSSEATRLPLQSAATGHTSQPSPRLLRQRRSRSGTSARRLPRGVAAPGCDRTSETAGPVA